MISRYTTRQGLTWIDLESPTKEEAEAIAEEYSLHPLITTEIVSSSERAKVDIYENGIYVILHFFKICVQQYGQNIVGYIFRNIFFSHLLHHVRYDINIDAPI